MARDMSTDKTLKHLRDMSFYKFAIGDVLVKQEKVHKWDQGNDVYEWKTSIAACGLPYKYVYLFENELNIGYIRRLSVNGRKFVDTPLCVTEFDPDYIRFELDPEYADHMLLSEEEDKFDTKSRYDAIKRRREQVNRKNKKMAVSLPDVAAAVDWMSKLKVGDQIWYGHGITNIHKDPYFIHEINLVEPPDWKAQQAKLGYGSWSHQVFEPYLKISTQAPNGSNMPTGYNNSLSANSLTSYVVFAQRPTFVEEIIN
jgi:hypothetical protein